MYSVQTGVDPADREEEVGLTGVIQFLPNGKRVNYTLLIMKLKPGGATENVGIYTPPEDKSDELETGNVTIFPRTDRVTTKPAPIYAADGIIHGEMIVTTLMVSTINNPTFV